VGRRYSTTPGHHRRLLEIAGYRQALGYVLAMSEADYATFDTTELRALYPWMRAKLAEPTDALS
jgi:hypothetical protein